MELSRRVVIGSLIAAAAVGASSALAIESIAGDEKGRVDKRYITGVEVYGVRDGRVSSGDWSLGDVQTRTIDPNSGAVPVPQLVSGLGVVPGLVEVQGVLERDRDDFRLNGRELDMGPDRWLERTTATGDLDGDGSVTDWWSELMSAVGRSVTVLGDVDDDDIDVFEINGLLLRPVYSEIAPWSDEWNGNDIPDEVREALKEGLSADEAARLALEQVTGVITDIQIDINDGRPYWEIDVRTPSGEIYDVELDALTGRIIEIDPT
jgi:hypothetical protein